MAPLLPQSIKITHVINPHSFWIKYLDKPNDEVAEFENELRNYVNVKKDEMCAINSDGLYRSEPVVAAYQVRERRWIRAEIEKDIDDDDVIVWATDYGYPLRMPLQQIVLLDDKLKEKSRTIKSNVLHCGIHGIMPQIKYLTTSEPSSQWQPQAIEIFDHFKSYPAYFSIKFHLNEHHVFGKLHVVHKGVERFIGEFLCNEGLASKISSFEIDIMSSKTVKIMRWQDNKKKLHPTLEKKDKKPKPLAVSPAAVSNTQPMIDQEKILQHFESQNRPLRALRPENKPSTSYELPSKAHLPQTVVTKSELHNSVQAALIVTGRQLSENKASTSSGLTSSESLYSRISSSSAQNDSKQASQIENRRIQSTVQTVETISKNLSSLANNPEEKFLEKKIRKTKIFMQNNDEDPTSMNAANFTNQVHNCMRLKQYTETYPIQEYGWPNILRSNSVVIDDSKGRGKTEAYLAPLISMVQRSLEDEDIDAKITGKSKPGAIAIIVCLTSSVSKIASRCTEMLQMPVFKTKVVEAIGTRDSAGVSIKLYNGCNILVTTVPCLFELIKKPVINNDKLKCVAFENIDLIMEKHARACGEIINKLCMKIARKNANRQFIVTSRTWINPLKQFLSKNLIADSVLLIGNYMEAARYAASFGFTMCNNTEKLSELKKHIQSLEYRKERTLVICNDMQEVSQVAQYLTENNIPNDSVLGNTNYAMMRARSYWEKLEGVLICTDDHLDGPTEEDVLSIFNAQNIVHFSLPRENYKTFLFRFSTMLDYYGDTPDAMNGKPRATSFALYAGENLQQFPKLVELLKRDGHEVPQEIMDMSQRVRARTLNDRAQMQRYVPICDSVFMHGVNEHHSECKLRHMMLKSDILPDEEIEFPSGTLRFEMLKIVSPSEYIVRPIKLLQAYYLNQDNCELIKSPEMGQKCVVISDNLAYRAEIVNVIEKCSFTNTDKCDLRFMDTGEMQIRSVTDLYALHEQFQSLPNQAYNLHLTSIVPADKEDDWDPRISHQTKSILNNIFEKERNAVVEMEEKKDNVLIYEANVLFSIRNTIVIDVMRLINTKHGTICVSLKSYLNNKGYCVDSRTNRDKVIDMATSLGVKVAKQKKKVAKTENPSTSSTVQNDEPPTVNGEPSQANISSTSDNELQDHQNASNDSVSESSADEFCENWANPWKSQHNKIQISRFPNPNDFYVTDVAKMDSLYKAIDKHIKEIIEPDKDNSMAHLDIYKYCLVKSKDEKTDVDYFDRGKILEIRYTEDESTMIVFMVDIGTIRSVDTADVYDISDDLIQNFPFQAIWCNLAGIKPTDGANGWSEEMNNAIYAAIDCDCDDTNHKHYAIHLHTITSNRAIKSAVPDTDIIRYDVVLLGINGHEQINLNELLVEKKLADYDPQTKNQLKNIPILVDSEDSEGEEDDDNWDDEKMRKEWERQRNSTPNQLPPSNNGDEPEGEFFDNDFINLIEKFSEDQIREFFFPNQQVLHAPIEEGEEEEKEGEDIALADEPMKDESQSNGGIVINTTNDRANRSVEDKGFSKTDHKIEYLHNHPKIYWKQNEESIVLKIVAHDDIKYGLEVTEDSLVYGTMENGVQKAAIINFFGTVDYEHTQHEVRGLNVVIRLRKLCPELWPRLLHTDDKCNWLQLEHTALDDDIDNIDRRMQLPYNCVSDEEDNSDTEDGDQFVDCPNSDDMSEDEVSH